MSEYRSANSTWDGPRHRAPKRRPWLVQIFRHVVYVGLGGE